MTVIGITGQVGSGKTFAVEQMKTYLSFNTIDLDHIGHHCLKEPSIKKVLITVFGDHILKDGEIDRKVLGAEVFSDIKKLQQLNKVVHPMIKENVIKALQSSSQKVSVIVGALIKEIGLMNFCDYIIVLDSNRKKARKASNRKMIAEAYQLSQDEYKSLSTNIVYNNFDKIFAKDLKKMVHNLLIN
ncbi:dephospho-CoA kinase [Candidatus Marinamargulisbacteria bacterium SCGC AG-343-D04]|nr:dephospho-CoA kinase [Candidatus Marinamargulisbacteria bacterium SCGC AG-343-D04]